MEGFAFDLDMDMATECTIADIQGQLADMLDMKSFLRKNMNVELKRWFSFTYSFPTLDKEWTAVHAVLTWMQFQMAEWRPETLKDLDALVDLAKDPHLVAPEPGPGPGHGPPPPLADDPGPGPAPDASLVEQRAADEAAAARDEVHAKREFTLAQLREKTKNTLLLAGAVSADREVQTHGRVIYEFELLGRKSVARDLELQRTQFSTTQWYAQRVLDGGHELCVEIFSVLDSITFLGRVGLGPQVTVSGRHVVYEDLELAEMICKLAVAYVALTAWTDSVHAQTLPFTLALGLHTDAALATAGLQACQKDWEAILEVEDALFKKATVAELPQPDIFDEIFPDDPGFPEGGPGPANPPDPGAPDKSLAFLHRLLEDLDFHKHQLVRETCFLFSEPGPDYDSWDPFLPDGVLQLWQMFATPANTKFWCEDVFKDLKQILASKAANVNRMSRMKAVMEAAERSKAAFARQPHDPDAHATHKPMDQVKLEPHEAGLNMPKSLSALKDGCFSFPSDERKVALAAEAGLTFDLGQPAAGLRPVIDLSLLMDVEKQKRKVGLNPGADPVPWSDPAAGPGPGPDPDPAPGHGSSPISKPTWKPAGKEANMRSVAAMALVRALAGKSGMEKEADARDAWWICLLRKGLFFQYEAPGQSPCVFLSLGFHGHAALCWLLDVISGPDLGDGRGAREYLQLSKVGLQRGRCNQPLPFRLVFGHEVKHLAHFQGLVVELLIPALKPPIAFGPDAVRGLGPGIVYQVTAKQEMLAFCFQQKVPLTSQQLVLLAKFLGLRLQRVVRKTAQKESAMLAAQAVALHVLPDLPAASRDEIVKAIVTGCVSDLALIFDPLLCPVIEEIRARNNVDLPKHIVKALDEQHQAAKGQALQGAAPQVSRERRTAMAQVARLEKNSQRVQGHDSRQWPYPWMQARAAGG